MPDRIAIIGSRHWSDYGAVADTIDALPADAIVITGCCPTGVDYVVREHCAQTGRVVVVAYAPWEIRNRAAGPIRNGVIVALADRIIAFDQGGPGTADVVRKAERAGKPVEVRRG